MITIAFTYFKSLTLANLAAALYSVRRQDLSQVSDVVVMDNDTIDSARNIQAVIDAQAFSVPSYMVSIKHGDPSKAQAWSTNFTVRHARAPWVFYTRADYLLDFDMLKKFVAIVDSKPKNWNGFIVSNGGFLHVPIGEVEQTSWRIYGSSSLRLLHNTVYDYTVVDSGVWMARRASFVGFDERLSAWGHAQTEFQWRMHQAGVEFVRIPETLFWHPAHGGEKDIDVAHAQLAAQGGDLKAMWARYHGVSPYA
jgi:GT2 family glycosyltransferase